jgi:hypothetical protein
MQVSFTQLQLDAVLSDTTLWHVSPDGQVPLHVPAVSAPHGVAQSVAGPGQQAASPVADRQMQACSQTPSLHVSAVHPTPSSQSLLVARPDDGSVVVVVPAHSPGCEEQAPAARRQQSFG